MAPQDIAAIATYLEALPPAQERARAAAPAAVAPIAATDIAEVAGRIGSGERLYRNYCAACHQVDGDGKRGLPALRNHAVLRYPSADNVAMAVLEGVWPEEGQGMPAFHAELDDGQVADVTNYVMTSFGHSVVTIDAKRVAALRAGGEASPLLLLSRIGMVAGVVLLAALAWFWRRRRLRRHLG